MRRQVLLTQVYCRSFVDGLQEVFKDPLGNVPALLPRLFIYLFCYHSQTSDLLLKLSSVLQSGSLYRVE